MMIWEEEFGKEYRIPKRILELVRQNILEDVSAGDDPWPSFRILTGQSPSKSYYFLTIDHPMPSRRHDPDRYTIYRAYAGNWPYNKHLETSTNKLDEILGMIWYIVNREMSM